LRLPQLIGLISGVMTGVTAGAGMGFVGAVIDGDSLLVAAFFLAGRRAALRAGRLAAFREDFFFPDDLFFEAFFLATRFFEDFLEDFFEDFLEDFLEDFFLAFFAPPFFFEPPFFLLAMSISFQCWTDCLSCARPEGRFYRTTKLSIRIERDW
jgi:hypothetical protein